MNRTSRLFLAPHNDDETLFGAFTILRERPLVIVVFDSWNQWLRGHRITAEQRRTETLAALRILEAGAEFLGFKDSEPDPEAIAAALGRYGQPEMVYAPAVEPDGNAQHNLVGEIAVRLFPKVTRYMTYTAAGKSRGKSVPVEPGWAHKKLRALACYASQIELPDTRDHFLRDQYEYYQA